MRVSDMGTTIFDKASVGSPTNRANSGATISSESRARARVRSLSATRLKRRDKMSATDMHVGPRKLQTSIYVNIETQCLHL